MSDYSETPTTITYPDPHLDCRPEHIDVRTEAGRAIIADAFGWRAAWRATLVRYMLDAGLTPPKDETKLLRTAKDYLRNPERSKAGTQKHYWRIASAVRELKDYQS